MTLTRTLLSGWLGIALIACNERSPTEPPAPEGKLADAAPIADAARVADAARPADAAPVSSDASVTPSSTVPRARWPAPSLGPGETAGGVLDKLQLTPPELTPAAGPDGIRRSAPIRWVSKSGHAVLVSIVFTKNIVALRAQWHDPEPRVQDVFTIKGTIEELGEPFFSDFYNGDLVAVIKVSGEGKRVAGKHAVRLRFNPRRGFKVIERHHYQGNQRGAAEGWIFGGGENSSQVYSMSRNNRLDSLRGFWWRGFTQRVVTVRSDGSTSQVERPVKEVLAEWARLGAIPKMPYEWKCDRPKGGCCESQQPDEFAPFWHIDRVCYTKGPHGPVFGEIRVREPR
jgi:hypothetical protein